MKKWRVLSSFAAAALLGMLAAAPAYAKETQLPEGLYIGEISLGGLTEEEARQKVKEYVDSIADRAVTLDVDGVAVETTAADLGFAWSNEDAVEEAAGHAVKGNLIERYMGQKDLEKNPVHIALETAVDEQRVEDVIRENFEDIAGEPQNATITRGENGFEITPGVAGRVVDAAATKAAIDQALAETEGEAVQVQAAVATQEPQVTEEDLATIQDVLGTFSTDFSSSGASRSGNLSNGASKINGRVLMPGETLSGYECMQPFTTENGYFTAAAYENGRVVDSIGGGVCQIATTLYNAALRAELEITQRQNHSMIVTYVKPSMDAAIAGTYKDIKITNNYSTPIYIEGGTSGKTLTFTIYGKETRPENRTVEYVSETISSIDPGAPTEQVDMSMAPGTRRQVQSAHQGLKSRLWKVVKIDGVETERTLLHTDTYNASKAIVLVGPPAAPAATEETQIAESQPQQEEPAETVPSVVEGENGGPGVSASITAGQRETVPEETQSQPETGSEEQQPQSETASEEQQPQPEAAPEEPQSQSEAAPEQPQSQPEAVPEQPQSQPEAAPEQPEPAAAPETSEEPAA